MRAIFLSGFLLSACTAFSQLDNTYLRDQVPLTNDSNSLGLDINACGYLRNTEYFNRIEPGRTLFGYQLAPSLFYQPAPTFRIQAGVFLREDFGSPVPFTQVLPTFTLKVKKMHFSMLFGTLEGALSHRMIEPIFNVESVIARRTENGLQFKYDAPRQFTDVWINWENFIERGSPYKEVFTAGVSNLSTVIKKGGFSISVPLQFLLHHHGGQITTDTGNMTMQMNAAAGLRISNAWDARFLRECRVDGYYTIYNESTSSGYFPYRSGNGIYVNGLVRTSVIDLMLSYWKADSYLAPRGTYIYASQSIHDPVYTEKNRELIFVRLMREQQLVDGLYLTARAEPVYDVGNAIFDYSYSLYLTYRKEVAFGKGKR